MIDEADVLREFLHGPLTFRDACIALQKIGYPADEANRVVTEWADTAEPAHSDYDEQMGGY